MKWTIFRNKAKYDMKYPNGNLPAIELQVISSINDNVFDSTKKSVSFNNPLVTKTIKYEKETAENIKLEESTVVAKPIGRCTKILDLLKSIFTSADPNHSNCCSVNQGYSANPDEIGSYPGVVELDGSCYPDTINLTGDKGDESVLI
ncbi:hypothetical protein [Candidatus Tisiphia endosymbiont of Hybos culiciformis]|uniref:hypothetical protein n=1 Tax=Candidatus Tisiphia endosymbiont of Hybos culiciformis TaxID=3139331 RepID=UPI003CCB1E1A